MPITCRTRHDTLEDVLLEESCAREGRWTLLSAHLNTNRRAETGCSHLSDYTICRDSPPFAKANPRKFRLRSLATQLQCLTQLIRDRPSPVYRHNKSDAAPSSLDSGAAAWAWKQILSLQMSILGCPERLYSEGEVEAWYRIKVTATPAAGWSTLRPKTFAESSTRTWTFWRGLR